MLKKIKVFHGNAILNKQTSKQANTKNHPHLFFCRFYFWHNLDYDAKGQVAKAIIQVFMVKNHIDKPKI